jgi:glycosyltransferase
MLVIDGASSDATLKIVESFGSGAIRVFSEKDKGVYDAMNKGFRLFQGDAIGFLNSDDTFHDSGVLAISPRRCGIATSSMATSTW